MTHTAFFDDRKATFGALEDAMDWLDQQASRFGMRGHEAEAKGYGQIFKGADMRPKVAA